MGMTTVKRVDGSTVDDLWKSKTNTRDNMSLSKIQFVMLRWIFFAEQNLNPDIHIWLVSTPLKNISQIGSCPQVGVKIKNIWNHHLDILKNQKKCFYVCHFWRIPSPLCHFVVVFVVAPVFAGSSHRNVFKIRIIPSNSAKRGNFSTHISKFQLQYAGCDFGIFWSSWS